MSRDIEVPDNISKEGELFVGGGEGGDVVHGNLLLREQAQARRKAAKAESKKKKDANAIKDCVPLIDVVKVGDHERAGGRI